jgi:hypothetical protein
LPLSPGAVEPVDASAFQGVRFEARGDGVYRLLVATASVRDYAYFGADFNAGPEWKTVSIPFTALSRPPSADKMAWMGRDLLAFAFEISREAGRFAWLELDNVRFW